MRLVFLVVWFEVEGPVSAFVFVPLPLSVTTVGAIILNHKK
jgi:hypothetical protein